MIMRNRISEFQEFGLLMLRIFLIRLRVVKPQGSQHGCDVLALQRLTRYSMSYVRSLGSRRWSA